MVNSEIPKHYTASPSSWSGTPVLTINKDATECLDSSNAFEGPEKLLEVWFSPSAAALPATAKPNGLKAVAPETWKSMLDIVNCQVLSTIMSEHVDAYLLSESSMFVFPHKLVLKTCGTTTLLLGLPRMLEIAGIEAGFPASPDRKGTAAYPHRVFYSRKNFQFPDKQVGPHRSWRDEVSYLDRQFGCGSAYMIGKMNGEHWYLYITSPNMMMTPPLTPDEEKKFVFQHAAENGLSTEQVRSLEVDSMGDETLEILMTDLDEENARQFYEPDAMRILNGDHKRKAHTTRVNAVDHLAPIPEQKGVVPILSEADDAFDVFAKQSLELTDEGTAADESDNEELSMGHMMGAAISDHCGLSDVYSASEYPDARIDSYVFSPCGFSANGVVPSPKSPELTHYFNVHVTPEPGFSYASFETNVPVRQTGRETADVVAQVIKIFKPGRFSVTLFEAKSEDGGYTKLKKGHRMDDIPGYKRVDRVLHDLEGYELVFRHFERDGFTGGRSRVGEEM